jgi:FKBP-type peptidyl-prolyl cis-trans isomerase FklB
MHKSIHRSVIAMIVIGFLLAGPARGQAQTGTAQQPASQQPAAQGTAPKPAAPKTSTGAAAKTGQRPAAKAPVPLTLKTQKDKLSYAIGMNVGKSLHRDGVDVDTVVLLRALKDALADSKPLMTDDEAKAAIIALQNDLRKKQEEKAAIAGEVNKKQGTTFLEANKAKDGVVTLPSGLQYKVLTQGTGPMPKTTDSVVCNYRGTLIDGTEFDSSYKRGQPATFPVTGVIKGWTEALQLMPVGSKWELFVPAELAYGAQQRGPAITPNSTLIFEVELLSIQPQAPATPPAPPAPPAATPPQTPPPQAPKPPTSR